jgi:hypothetical protein
MLTIYARFRRWLLKSRVWLVFLAASVAVALLIVDAARGLGGCRPERGGSRRALDLRAYHRGQPRTNGRREQEHPYRPHTEHFGEGLLHGTISL